MHPPLSDYQVEERAAAATALLNDPVILEVLKEMHDTYVATLLRVQVGTPEALTAHAGIRLVEDFRNGLIAKVTEKRMRDHRRKVTSQ